MLTIQYAAYGMNANIVDLTGIIASLYEDNAIATFQVAPNPNTSQGGSLINGKFPIEDPDPGVGKCLFIVWMNSNKTYSYGTTYDADPGNITIQ